MEIKVYRGVHAPEEHLPGAISLPFEWSEERPTFTLSKTVAEKYASEPNNYQLWSSNSKSAVGTYTVMMTKPFEIPYSGRFLEVEHLQMLFGENVIDDPAYQEMLKSLPWTIDGEYVGVDQVKGLPERDMELAIVDGWRAAASAEFIQALTDAGYDGFIYTGFVNLGSMELEQRLNEEGLGDIAPHTKEIVAFRPDQVAQTGFFALGQDPQAANIPRPKPRVEDTLSP